VKPHRIRTPRQEITAENYLYQAILTLQTPKECKRFFRDLCTPAELQALTDRWSVVEPLVHGVPYRKISEKTGVSVTTIGRVARFLTDGNGGYRITYDRLKKN